ncbi:diacylglycerol/lipid kinase family protein [Solicola sp. PLA-1-18]|uniref:diacylglycerol/lipid kinase family protein n=1 Tax=Solicola sp. PLA-1-18 TaxID=3380532 RepID=UPI003B7BFE1E
MDDILLISNAKAGTAADDAVEAAVGVLRGEHSIQVVATESLEDLGDVLAKRAADGGPGTVVVVGGDGSLHAVVQVLHDRDETRDVVLGLVPLGTGNDFARTVGVVPDPEAAAQQLLAAEERDVDLIVDDAGGVVVNAVHLGLGAEAGVAAKPWKARLGPLGYVVGAFISGFTKPGKDVAVRVDGEPVRGRGRTLQVALGNGRYVGGGTALVPHADPSDGKIDVEVSFADPLMRRLSYAISLRFGVQDKRDDVSHARGAEVHVRGEEFRCNADGEIGDPVTERTWHVEPAALRMLLPPPPSL